MPVRMKKLPGKTNKYRVYDGDRVAAYATTKTKAERQVRLLRAIAHGLVPRN
jgi:hypothetical protein